MELANRILELLYDREGGFFALEELVQATVAGHAKVEEALAELAQRGHRFERPPAHGVRLIRPTVMDAHLIERNLPVEHIGRHIICFDQADSTNDIAFSSISQAAGQALVVTAEYQRAGRGRLGRKWFSPSGSAVLASVLLHRRAGDLPQEALTLAAGLVVAEGIEESTGVTSKLDWPNDVVIGESKLAGILVEVRGKEIVIGFGINVFSTPPIEQVSRPATCLAKELGGISSLERIEILRSVLGRMDWWVSALQDGRSDELHDRWCSRCGMVNRRIRIQSSGNRFTGRVIDVSPYEGLVVLDDDGQRLHFPAATSTIVE
jgi:BirA family biotin operon repressor/biotin-[acetyl-CoA-carboxylase] ligase